MTNFLPQLGLDQRKKSFAKISMKINKIQVTWLHNVYLFEVHARM